jgi:hypothetical protein
MYVDLNPIHAGQALSPEEARYTSAYDRIQGMRSRAMHPGDAGSADHPSAEAIPADGWLCELTIEEGPDSDVRRGISSSTPWRSSDKGLLPISVEQYLELLDWTGRQLRSDKPGAIPANLAPILERLHIRPDHCLEAVRGFDQFFHRAAGRAEHLATLAARAGRRWLQGTRAAAKLFR